MRQAHYLKKNKVGRIPQHCIFVDTETKPVKTGEGEVENELWFGYACYLSKRKDTMWSKKEWVRFTTPGEFWDYVIGKQGKKKKIFVYAHNMEFDFTVLKGFEYLVNNGWEPKGCIMESPPTIITFRKDTCTIVMVCTLNYFKASLASIGESIGYNKGSFPDYDDDIKIWNTYCERDVEIITEAMLSYFNMLTENDLGNYQLTIASQAFSTFRHRFMKHRIYIDDNEKAAEIARKAYFGGRTEVFRMGGYKGNMYCVDINSQYPSVMRDNYFPVLLGNIIRNPPDDFIVKALERFCVIAEVNINTDKPNYPVRHDGKLIFPIGKFTTFLATPELQLAWESGHIDSVSKISIYEKEYIFRYYVDYMYSKRLEYKESGNLTFALMYKYLLNSLYGKFGQNGKVFAEIDRDASLDTKSWTELDVETGERLSFRQYAGIREVLLKESESRESFPAIAAHVTSYARIMFLKYKNIAGHKNVLYGDTDSLFITPKGLENLQSYIDPVRLGYLKIEFIADDLVIRGCKDYYVLSKDKIKGIRKETIPIADWIFAQDQFRGFKGMIRKGDLNAQIVKSIKKVLDRKYTKGVVLKSGWIKPFLVGTDIEIKPKERIHNATQPRLQPLRQRSKTD